ncbi:hypothetical protein ACFX13_015933 [Malus domestica]
MNEDGKKRFSPPAYEMSNGQVLLDHQRFVGLFQRHLLPSSSGIVPRNEAPNDQPLKPSLSRTLPTAETSPKQPL